MPGRLFAFFPRGCKGIKDRRERHAGSDNRNHFLWHAFEVKRPRNAVGAQTVIDDVHGFSHHALSQPSIHP